MNRILTICVKIYVACIRVIYVPMKLKKIKNKILFMSRQSNEKSADMKMLEDEIERISPDTELVFRLKKLKDEKSLSLSYIFSIFADMWQMADAKVIVVDTYIIPVSCLHHKNEQNVVQIWHALGATKKFGLQSVGLAQGRSTSVAKAMHMHENYDYVIAPSEATGEFYCESFDCDMSKVKIISLPRVDYIVDGKSRREEFLELNPEYAGKKIVAYIPTFRTDDDLYANKIYDAFKSYEGIGLVISAHPLSKTKEKGRHTLNGSFSSRDIMKFADVIITDYSACAYEAALLKKPLYFYVPDYDQYDAEQGLNVNLFNEMKGCTYRNAEELINTIENTEYDFERLTAFLEKYVECRDNDNTERMAEFFVSLIK